MQLVPIINKFSIGSRVKARRCAAGRSFQCGTPCNLWMCYCTDRSLPRHCTVHFHCRPLRSNCDRTFRAGRRFGDNDIASMYPGGRCLAQCASLGCDRCHRLRNCFGYVWDSYRDRPLSSRKTERRRVFPVSNRTDLYRRWGVVVHLPELAACEINSKGVELRPGVACRRGDA